MVVGFRHWQQHLDALLGHIKSNRGYTGLIARLTVKSGCSSANLPYALLSLRGLIRYPSRWAHSTQSAWLAAVSLSTRRPVSRLPASTQCGVTGGFSPTQTKACGEQAVSLFEFVTSTKEVHSHRIFDMGLEFCLEQVAPKHPWSLGLLLSCVSARKCSFRHLDYIHFTPYVDRRHKTLLNLKGGTSYCTVRIYIVDKEGMELCGSSSYHIEHVDSES